MILLNPTLRLYTKRAFTFGQLTHCHPFLHIDDTERPSGSRRVECIEGWKKGRVIWLLNVTLTFLYFVFLLLRAIQVHHDHGSSPSLKFYLKLLLLWCLFPTLFQLTLLIDQNTLAIFHDLNFELMTRLQDDLSPLDTTLVEKKDGKRRERRISKLYDYFFIYNFYSMALFPVGLMLIAAFKPNSPNFISSIFIRPDDRWGGPGRTIIILSSILFHGYYGYMQAAIVFLILFVGAGFLISGNFTIHTMRQLLEVLKRGTYTPAQKARALTLILGTYRQFQVFLPLANVVFCRLALPVGKVTLMFTTALSIYCTIRLDGGPFVTAMTLVMATVSILCLFFLAYILGLFYDESKTILELLKDPTFHNSLTVSQRKMIQSLTPLKFKMRSSYFMDKGVRGTIFKTVLDWTINLLLAV